ncbi:hypothetical protein PSHT_10854 [Puccinia striiformis]|uniref:Uncharacterized protein n=1 Tax=Puccinia striiformis TaxID=27350 RepID=A0A2S4V714_9BASI|nr:hypothetical protein PSHT_10854 [Puccinia striiformis]
MNNDAEPPVDEQHVYSQEITQPRRSKRQGQSLLALQPTHSTARLSAPDSALMASTTIETNEFYQEHYKTFLAFETQLIRDLFVSEISLFLTKEEFTERIEEIMSKNKTYQEIQSTVLQLRIKRHYYDGIVKSMENPITPSSLSQPAI